MKLISKIGTLLNDISVKTYGPFLLLGVIVIAAILLASYAFPDEDEEEDE